MALSLRHLGLWAGCFALVAASACSSSSDSPVDGSVDSGADVDSGVDGSAGGGAVAGDVDNHCGAKIQETKQSSCHVPAPDGGVPAEEEAPVLYNASGDDDDCKYHLSFTSTAVSKNGDTYITVVVTSKSDGKPVTGANVDVEAFLTPIHPLDTSAATSVEAPPGTYKIGPLRFDASGKWTVRFHLFELCTDSTEDTPHGHAAFFFAVP
jgi:hypothetical protein